MARLLEPGGTLLYAVCSFEPEETDAVVESAAEATGLRSVAVPEGPGISGLSPGRHGLYSLPSTAGEDGYYLAALQRQAEA